MVEAKYGDVFVQAAFRTELAGMLGRASAVPMGKRAGAVRVHESAPTGVMWAEDVRDGPLRVPLSMRMLAQLSVADPELIVARRDQPLPTGALGHWFAERYRRHPSIRHRHGFTFWVRRGGALERRILSVEDRHPDSADWPDRAEGAAAVAARYRYHGPRRARTHRRQATEDGVRPRRASREPNRSNRTSAARTGRRSTAHAPGPGTLAARSWNPDRGARRSGRGADGAVAQSVARARPGGRADGAAGEAERPAPLARSRSYEATCAPSSRQAGRTRGLRARPTRAGLRRMAAWESADGPGGRRKRRESRSEKRPATCWTAAPVHRAPALVRLGFGSVSTVTRHRAGRLSTYCLSALWIPSCP
jgi:hypothetical protein